MERLCLDCNGELKGRTDKKFCDDLCRSNFNNRLKANDHSFLRQVNNILKKNRDILKLKIPNGSKVKKDVLLRKDFNFSYYTHVDATQKGNYFFCYEYGYMALANEEFLLVKREE